MNILIYDNGNFVIKWGNVKKNNKNSSVVSWGMVVMFMMFSSTYAPKHIKLFACFILAGIGSDSDYSFCFRCLFRSVCI